MRLRCESAPDPVEALRPLHFPRLSRRIHTKSTVHDCTLVTCEQGGSAQRLFHAGITQMLLILHNCQHSTLLHHVLVHSARLLSVLSLHSPSSPLGSLVSSASVATSSLLLPPLRFLLAMTDVAAATVSTATEERVGGDTNYALHGTTYTSYRQTEPRIAALIHSALGLGQGTRTVLNVGAGAGSYEPHSDATLTVTAVEPSAAMRQKRPAHLPAAVDAKASSLPFADGAFDAAMATFTIHQWPDLTAGLTEVRRVTRGPIVLLTCDPDAVMRFWLHDYAPEVTTTEASRYPPLSAIAAALPNDTVTASPAPIPFDCVDGFNEVKISRHRF